MTWFLIILRKKHTIFSDFTLPKSLKSMSCFKNDVSFVDFPESVSFTFYSDDQEVYRNVRSLGHFFILLHQTQNNVCFFSNRKSELWIVKPLIIGVKFRSFVWIRCILLSFDWIRPSCSVASPFSLNGVLRPSRWEDFTQV